MVEQARMVASEKAVKKFALLWTWGRRCACVGVALAFTWAFMWAILGIYVEMLIIICNVLIFSGMAVAYVGFRRLTSLVKELGTVPEHLRHAHSAGKQIPKKT